MNRCLGVLLWLAALPACAEPLLFVYFREPANMGVFFAVSDDGYRWEPLNGDKPWFGIEHPPALIRDPFVTRGPDGEFHMVWTWGWRGTSIGYAHSRDLVRWSPQREIPLMAGTPGTKNTWAPEIYWVNEKKKWLVIWSSTVEGRHEGNRIYSALTPDFETFGPPALYFDPGYMVIDATILRARGRYYLVFKDERPNPVHKALRTAEGPSLEGPWSNIGDEFTEAWSEGPSAVEIGGKYVVYYDHYRDPKRYEAVRSTDLRRWIPATDEMRFPSGCKHGSFLQITEQEKRRLQEYRP